MKPNPLPSGTRQSADEAWYGARQIVRPVALEERPKVAIPLTDGLRLADKLAIAKANVNLYSAILIPFRNEADLVKGSAPGLRRSISIRGANRARASTSAATVEIEGQCREHRLRRDGALPPLKRPKRLVGAVEGYSLADESTRSKHAPPPSRPSRPSHCKGSRHGRSSGPGPLADGRRLQRAVGPEGVDHPREASSTRR